MLLPGRELEPVRTVGGLAPGQAAPTAVGQLASVRIAGNLTNLAINGGFEPGPLGTQTSGWQTDAGVTLTGVSGPLAPDQGSGYAVVTAAAGSPTPSGIFESIPIYLNAPSTVCASVKISSSVRAPGPWGARDLGEQWRRATIGADGHRGRPVDADPDPAWIRPSAVTSIAIRVYTRSIATVPLAVDSVVVNADLIADGGFNAGNSPWQVAPPRTSSSTGRAQRAVRMTGPGSPRPTRPVPRAASTRMRRASAGRCDLLRVCARRDSRHRYDRGRRDDDIDGPRRRERGPDQSSSISFKNLPGTSAGVSSTNWQAEYTCLTVTGTNAIRRCECSSPPRPAGRRCWSIR